MMGLPFILFFYPVVNKKRLTPEFFNIFLVV